MIDLLCVGHASFDVAMGVTHHPCDDEKMRAESLRLSGGGPAANAAVMAAKLGGRVGFCGYLGHDLFGDAHAAELEAAGVDIRWLARGRAATPLSQILAKPDGTRSVVNYRGALQPLAAAWVAQLEPLPAVVLMDGHEPHCGRQLIAMAQENCATRTVLDAGSLHAGTAQLMGAVDYLVASEPFARQYYAATHGADACGTPMDWLKALAAQSRGAVVVTCGAGGLIWSRDGQCGELAAFAVDALDSTGAGDAFHGAFALGVARGMDWLPLLRFASACGALTCCQLGARAAQPDAAMVAALLDDVCS